MFETYSEDHIVHFCTKEKRREMTKNKRKPVLQKTNYDQWASLCGRANNTHTHINTAAAPAFAWSHCLKY